MRAYHGVVGGCSRGESRSGGGFTSHSGRFAAAGRESDYGASPQATSRVGQTATRGASPRSTARNAQHQWLTESHIRLAVGSLPTGQAAAVHYAQAGAVGDCASRNDGVSAGIEASGAAALTSLGGDWSGQSGDELVARGRAHSVETRSPHGAVCPGGDSTRPQGHGVGGWGAAQAGGIESNRRCHMFGLRGAGLRGGAVFGQAQSGSGLRQAQQGDLEERVSVRDPQVAKAPGEERRLGNFLRLGGRVSCHSHPPGRQEVLYLFHRWESIPVRGPSLRLDTKPFCVHQGDAPSGAVFPFPQWRGSAFGGNQSTTASALEGGASGGSRKCEMSTLYGRLSVSVRHTGAGSDGSGFHRRHADSPRLEAQHQEVRAFGNLRSSSST